MDYSFVEKWINWIMEYITTKTFFVLVKGIPSEYFKLERGIM